MKIKVKKYKDTECKNCIEISVDSKAKKYIIEFETKARGLTLFFKKYRIVEMLP